MDHIRNEKIRSIDNESPHTLIIRDKEYVQVVRCKDCKYFHDYGDGVKNCWGDGGGMKDDDYCSQAKRKDE